MPEFPALHRLTTSLSRLPGIGRRSAERIAIRLVRRQDNLIGELIQAMTEAERSIGCCRECGSLTVAEENPCRLCTAPDRDDSIVCVVEDPSDILLMERAGSFNGRYHVLMGKLSPARGDGPRDLRLDILLRRVREKRVSEVVLALSTDVEGDATAAWLIEQLAMLPVRVSRLASGLPVGSGLAYADPVTVARAMRGRVMERDPSKGSQGTVDHGPV